MLFLVLVLILGALGLLVTVLVTAQSLWAWISIGVSVLAGLVLVLDVVRRRARRGHATEIGKPAEKPERLETSPSGPELGTGEAQSGPGDRDLGRDGAR